MSTKSNLLARARVFAVPGLRACGLGVLGFCGTAPAWAQVTQAGTPTTEDPTLDRYGSWHDGPNSGSDWNIVAGVGLRAAPEYEGADKLKLSPAPFAALAWKQGLVTLDLRGLAVYPVKTDNLRLGISVGYGPGRNEDRSDRLTGLGNIDGAVRTHALMDYRVGLLNFSVDASKDFGGSDGVEVLSSVSIRIPVAPRLSLLAGVSATWSDSRYTSAYFGVTSAQSIASGLPIYDAGAGFKRADADIGIAWAVSPRWSARAKVGVGRFVGDAADSPIIEKPTQPFIGLSLAHRF